MNSNAIDRQDERQMDAEGRDEFLRQLLQRSGWKVTAEVVRAARAELGIPRSTLFRLASRFLNTRRTSSLGAQKRGTPEGAYRIDAKMERVIAEQIEGFWLRKEKPKFSA
jgi:putative transposase